ncbi:MAG: glycosyltransferase family 9 protein [Candidatus Omnitrophota bacterium]
MRLRQKIIIDRFIGKPLAFLLNGVVWPLGKVARINHDDSPEKVKTIAVAKLLGMGSILRATPMVRALKQRYPSAKFIFITTLKNRPLVESLGLMDECLCLRDTTLRFLLMDTLGLLFKLWRYRVDLYFDLEVYSALSTILATLSLSRNRYGFYRTSTAFRVGLNTHLVYFNDAQPISKIYMELARACGIKHIDYKIGKIQSSPQARSDLKQWLNKHHLKEELDYIVINPNASDLLLERRWPSAYFVALINALAKDGSHPIFLVGSFSERAYVDGWREELTRQAQVMTFNACGAFSLEMAMALIAEARLMITNDSGLYHIATSFEIPVISLWGPVNPSHYADTESDHNFIFYSKDVYCSPCVHRTDFPPCKGNNICMKSISPKAVYAKACAILGITAKADMSLMMDEVYAKVQSQDFDIIIRTRKKRS